MRARFSLLRFLLVAALLASLAAPAVGAAQSLKTSLGQVRAEASRLALLASSFDLAEAPARDGWYDIVLHPGDAERLRALGFRYRVIVPDLARAESAARANELRIHLDQPGQRVTYRTLAEYEADLAQLAKTAPNLVREFILPMRTHEGRTVKGVEISAAVQAAGRDGRPTSLVMGLHHAREWPAGEVTIMFAQDLVSSYLAGDARITELLDHVKVIVIPVVNPDGFVRSRETVSDFVAPLPGVAANIGELAYHRKNMRKNTSALLELGQGVDPNRNYAYMWGGPGASERTGDATYSGPAPASEPEIANVTGLMSSNQVLTMVTNHTYSNLVLRPWGFKREDTADEAQLKALGDKMASFNHYKSQKGIDLYPVNGTAEDWLYGVMGGYGYTFEIGSAGATGNGNTTPAEDAGFHPQYNLHVPGMYALNRPAFLALLEAARDESMHSVITGTAVPGTRITLTKHVPAPLAREASGASSVGEHVEASIFVGPSGSYTWHVNPSPLPATVSRVRAKVSPAGELERYTVTATLPSGVQRSNELLVLRGQRYRLDFTK